MAPDLEPLEHNGMARPRTFASPDPRAERIVTSLQSTGGVPLSAETLLGEGGPLEGADPELRDALTQATDQHEQRRRQTERESAVATMPAFQRRREYGGIFGSELRVPWGPRGSSGLVFDTSNHPTTLRGQALERVRDAYAQAMGDRAWSPVAHRLFFGGEDPAQDPRTRALTPDTTYLQPSLATMRGMTLVPRGATVETTEREATRQDAVDHLVEQQKSQYREDAQRQKEEARRVGDQSKNNLPYIVEKQLENPEIHEALSTRAHEWLDSDEGGEWEKKFLAWRQDAYDRFRSNRAERQGQEQVLAPLRADNALQGKSSWTLDELLGHSSYLRTGNGRTLSTSTRTVRDPDGNERQVEEHISPMARVAQGLHVMNALQHVTLDQLSRHRAFAEPLVTDSDGRIELGHPANRAALKKQRKVVFDKVQRLQNAAHEYFQGNGFVDDTATSGDLLTMRTEHGMPTEQDQRRFVLRGGKTYRGHLVATSSDRSDRELYSPQRVQFDEQGRVTNPDEAKLNSSERKRARLPESSTYYAPLYVSNHFRNFADNLFDPTHGFQVAGDPEATQKLQSALGSTKIDTGWRSLMSGKPLNIVVNKGGLDSLMDEVSKTDPTLHGLLREHVTDFTEAPGSRSVSPSLVDQVVHRVYSIKGEHYREALRDKLKQSMERDLLKVRGSGTARGRRPVALKQALIVSNADAARAFNKNTLRISPSDRKFLEDQLAVARSEGVRHYTQRMNEEKVQTDWKGTGREGLEIPLQALYGRISLLEDRLDRSRSTTELQRAMSPEQEREHKSTVEYLKTMFGSEPYMPSHLRFTAADTETQPIKFSPGQGTLGPKVELESEEQPPAEEQTPVKKAPATKKAPVKKSPPKRKLKAPKKEEE